VSAEAFRFCPRCARPLARRGLRDDGGAVIERLACPDAACGFVQWGNPTPAVGALVEHEGEIVLARGQGWPEGWFALVTGYLEAREDPRAAVAREVREELGLETVSASLIGNYIFEKKNEVMLCYHVVATGTVRLGEEIAEIRRQKPADLKPWRRATGLAVADWMRSRGLPFEFADFPPGSAPPPGGTR
jgi:NADH pyrophosphatase NudC (nudix superfamily)